LKRVGLALGGGVARGAAHVGVLKVLQREQIPVACVSGASAGALVAALFCAGLRLSELEQALKRFGWRHIARPVFSRLGLISFEPMERWLASMIGDVTFAELRWPLAIVASDLESGLPVVLREGRVAPAVRASCTLPGVVVPLERDGRRLVDGCIANSVPVEAARQLGADYVIGVNLFGTVARRANSAPRIGVAALEHLLRRSGGGLEAADCLISPDLGSVSYVRFARSTEAARCGAAASEAQLPALRAALGAPQSKA
jgi:NTE family protein